MLFASAPAALPRLSLLNSSTAPKQPEHLLKCPSTFLEAPHLPGTVISAELCSKLGNAWHQIWALLYRSWWTLCLCCRGRGGGAASGRGDRAVRLPLSLVARISMTRQSSSIREGVSPISRIEPFVLYLTKAFEKAEASSWSKQEKLLWLHCYQQRPHWYFWDALCV